MGVSPHHGLSHSSLRMYLNDLVIKYHTIKCENEELWTLCDGINMFIELNLPPQLMIEAGSQVQSLMGK